MKTLSGSDPAATPRPAHKVQFVFQIFIDVIMVKASIRSQMNTNYDMLRVLAPLVHIE